METLPIISAQNAHNYAYLAQASHHVKHVRVELSS